MRITQNSMNRRYLTNLNRNLSDMASTSRKIDSGRGFTKMSENVTKGTRALALRTQLYKNVQQQDNVKLANEQLTIAEDNLTSIKDVLATVEPEALSALNGTKSQQELDIFAEGFDQMKGAILQFANCTFDDKYTFGGTNNSKPPFTVSENGDLLYNGVEVNGVTKQDGAFLAEDGTKVPYSDSIYVDIGLGMRFSNGSVDPRTVFDTSISGLDALGYGTTELTYENAAGEEVTTDAPNNVYELMGAMSDALRAGDTEQLNVLNGHMNKRFSEVVSGISELGIRSKFLINNQERLETENLSLTEMKGNTEGIEDAEEIANLKTYQYAYSLSIQLGSSLIPKSLMDYVQ